MTLLQAQPGLLLYIASHDKSSVTPLPVISFFFAWLLNSFLFCLCLQRFVPIAYLHVVFLYIRCLGFAEVLESINLCPTSNLELWGHKSFKYLLLPHSVPSEALPDCPQSSPSLLHGGWPQLACLRHTDPSRLPGTIISVTIVKIVAYLPSSNIEVIWGWFLFIFLSCTQTRRVVGMVSSALWTIHCRHCILLRFPKKYDFSF